MNPKETKQVIVMRRDLNMRKGKAAAQAAHVATAFITRQLQKQLTSSPDKSFLDVCLTAPQREWVLDSFVKVVCKVDDEEALVAIEKKAQEAGLLVHRCVDAGRTEFDGQPTWTCIAIGPDYVEKIDPITKDLALW